MRIIAHLAGALLLTNTAAALAVEKPEDFAIRFSVETIPNASLQRLALPREALAALQTANAADVRLFNGKGQSVPIAPIPQRNESIALAPREWPIYPVMATHPQQNLGNLSLRIEKTADRSVVHVIEGANAEPAAATRQIATLVDTRPIKGPLAELTVDAELAPGEPVALTVSASKDLKNWRTLAQDVPVFRFGADGPGSLQVPLPGVHLEEEYLRISWPPGAAFSLRGVRITPAASAARARLLAVPLAAKPDGKGLVIALPFATPLQALDIRPADANTLVPVRLSGRSVRGEPWRALATGVAYRLHADGGESFGPPLELNGATVRELRIEPATGDFVFASTPRVTALLLPQEWVFVASGPPPFILAVGRAGAETTRLPLASLIPGHTAGAEDKLPAARVNLASITRQPPAKLSRISQALGASSTRSLVLWAVLIGGVLVLGGVAWAVMRQMKSSDNPQT
ncbi:MAG: DUF3999 family protein [Thiobacillus sp.]|nr:DUF3999 family protein [Thiobacillus sp.]